MAAQIGAGGLFGRVGPEGLGQAIARQRLLAMQQEICQQRQRLRQAPQWMRRAVGQDAQMSEEVEAQHDHDSTRLAGDVQFLNPCLDTFLTSSGRFLALS